MKLLFLAQETSNYGYFWHVMVQLGIVGVLILFANTLRRKIPLLRRYLIPASLLAGFLGLGIKAILDASGLQLGGASIIDGDYMHYITYHSLAIGFIALGLVSASKQTVKDGRAMKSGILIVGGYLIQGVLGILFSVLVGAIFVGSAIGRAPYAGILFPLGFGQGPGQAGNIGGAYETLTTTLGDSTKVLAENALTGGRSFGLSIAALGIMIVCIVGTIALNIIARKGKIVRQGSSTDATFGDMDKSIVYAVPDEIPVVESVDKFTVQISFVLGTYLLTFGIISLLSFLIVDLAGVESLKAIIWGFNFLFAIFATMIIKTVVNILRKKKIMTRQYINDFMQNRIAGIAFDFMIAAAIISIDFGALNDPSYWVLLLLLGTIGTYVTYLFTDIICKRYFPNTRWYTFFAFFGMLTGTASEGIALLREIDPNFETGVAEDMVNGSGTAAIFGAPMLLIISFITGGTAALWISFGLLIVLFTAMMLLLEFYSRFIKKRNERETLSSE